jgi:thioredoxin-related protein
MKIKVLLFTFLLSLTYVKSINAQASASSLLQKAKIKAKQENKAIFIKFEASWCGFCHQMTKNMKAATTKQFFEDNFVMVPLVVFEVPSKKHLENP